MTDQNNFRVALVRAFSQSEYKEPAEPLGIEALGAMLRKYNIECRLFDREIETLDRVVDEIIEYNPSLLGLSILMEDNAPDALKLLLKVRSKLYVSCAIGGVFVTTSYNKARALFPNDCKLIVGEGEIALLKICSDLSGVVYTETNKSYLSPEEWPWMYRPNLQEYLNIGAPINMKSSRGCPGQCRFCATPYLPNGLSKWSGRNILDVADEMQFLCERYSPYVFNFVDDDFGSLTRIEELVDELCKRNLRCSLSLQLRASTVYNTPNYKQILSKLKAGGLSRVFIGLESFNEQTLSYFNKKLLVRSAMKVKLSWDIHVKRFPYIGGKISVTINYLKSFIKIIIC